MKRHHTSRGGKADHGFLEASSLGSLGGFSGSSKAVEESNEYDSGDHTKELHELLRVHRETES